MKLFRTSEFDYINLDCVKIISVTADESKLLDCYSFDLMLFLVDGSTIEEHFTFNCDVAFKIRSDFIKFLATPAQLIFDINDYI